EDAAKYGPWAGKILAGAQGQGAVYAVDAQGGATPYALGVNPEDVQVVPSNENFFGLDTAEGKLWGAPADAFAGLIGDILVAQESPGTLTRVRWNGTAFETGQIAQVVSWGQTAFAPAGVAQVRAVKQVYDRVAVVRHAPVLNSGRIEGALWQLSAENAALGGTDVITSDLLVPGRPTVSVGNSHPNFGGVIEGVEDSQPTNYTVSIGGNATLRHLITRTNPIKLASVAPPPVPAGARDVSLTSEGQSPGDFSTLRNLSLSGRAGAVSVPPGTYGNFSLAGRTALVLGVENATEAAVYNLQGLTLTGGSELRLKGPVVLTVRGDVSLTGSTVGAADAPLSMLLKVPEGSVKVGGGGVLYGVVRAPRGAVEIAGQGRVRGTVMCDRLTVSGGGVLQVTETDVPPPPVNRPPAVDAGADQVITLPASTVSLNGTASDDGLPQGSAPSVKWSTASGPGTVSFGSATSPATMASFSAPGLYVLKLTASDGMLMASDAVQVEVVPRNQPPVVNAGPDATVKPPNPVNLNGTVSDDALPHGSTVAVNWSLADGPGAVSFADAAAAATSATFDAPGTYTLRLSASDTEFTVFDELVVTVTPSNQPPTADAGLDQTVSLDETLPAPEEFRLRTISTGFNSPIGIDYHPPTGKVIMSVNYNAGGQPFNFETVAADGTHARFSNIRGLTDELKLATVRDDNGGGTSLGGFGVGEMFTGSGVPGVIVRVSPDGSQVQNPW
ncbi:MAG TPA: PKD domain-containing protein, partial [Pyrinomonadaceae bacterium]|nr:PKD domain-containing protein [Pyrinomonadaceae bacterium]